MLLKRYCVIYYIIEIYINFIVHKDLLSNNTAYEILQAFRTKNVTLYGGPRAIKALNLLPTTTLSREYSDLAITVEIVDDVNEAIDHINTYSSRHTDTIITENSENAKLFLDRVDSASVFHNASTRFADGFRYGLGAEVGISTGRIHARGPVGIEGLLTHKWKLVSHTSHTVASFALGDNKYTHKQLPLSKL